MEEAKRYEFFDHTADLGVQIWGATRKELFRNAAAALYEAMGAFCLRSRGTRRTLCLRATSREELLHDFLAELLYDTEARQIAYDKFEIEFSGDKQLRARLFGGKIDFKRSQLNEEIKAVTYHELKMDRPAGRRWRATVIFDV